MMDSFGRQEGGGFWRREGKLVSPVRRDYPLHSNQNPRREKEGEETRRKEERNPPLKSPPGKKRQEEEEKKDEEKG